MATGRRSPAMYRVSRMPRTLLAVALGAAWALLLALAFSAPAHAQTATARDDSGSLRIVVPTSSNGGPAGPVGTYVTVQGGSLTPNGTFKLGVALQDAGCQGGFTDLGMNPVPADSSGGLLKTFRWPSSINNTGSSYYVCLQDLSGGSFVQSNETFTVLGGSEPAITLAHTQPTPGPGTPTPATTPPQTGNVYHIGDYAQITGSNFLPGGTNLAVYLTTKPIISAQDLQSATPLQAIGGTISSDDSGSFTATVQIQPPSATTAPYYLYVVSGDADAATNARPSLEAERQIRVQPAPTPTATATATSTPAATPTVTGNGGGAGNGGGGTPKGAIIGLGIASVVLFIIGVILLASAATSPRPEQQQR